MQSHFSSQTLAEVFRDLYLGEHSGVLTLVREGVEKQVHFERGLIHFATSTLEEEGFGSSLVRERRISEGALAEAGQSEQPAPDLARTLVNRGLVSKAALGRTMRGIVDSVVQSVFAWEGGAARFAETTPQAEFFDTDVLSTFEVILRGIFKMAGFAPIREAMLGLDNRVRVRKPTPVPLERLTLSPAHGFILSRADGSSTVKEVLTTLPSSEDETASMFLFGLLVMGVLEYDPPLGDGPFRVANILRDHADRRALERMQEQTIGQAYKQMRVQSPNEVLGVTASASREAIERAYEEAKALFSRERILPRVREKYRAELAVIESRLIEAYLKLTQPDRKDSSAADEEGAKSAEDVEVQDLLVRVEMDKTKSKLAQEESGRIAENYFSMARKAMREGDYHSAIQYGKLAISYNDRDARYYYLLADCQVRNPEARWQRMAEQNYARAAELDPWNADYWISLGRFYKKRGLKLRARKQFEEALKIAPKHKVATEELETLD
jgi:tetratricopeptide (TPR) repeat protein